MGGQRTLEALTVERLTCAPVQNMGQSSHGGLRAFPSHVLRYGLRTIRGRTGGFSVDASTTVAADSIRAACIDQSPKRNILGGSTEDWQERAECGAMRTYCRVVPFNSCRSSVEARWKRRNERGTSADPNPG